MTNNIFAARCVLLSFLFLLTNALTAFAQVEISGKTAIGRWKTIDDETGKPKSVVEIYTENGKYTGKIVQLFRAPSEEQDPNCDKCTDYRKGQKIKGMVIIRNMSKKSDKYADGDILDPKKGSLYDLTMWLESENVLKIRGWYGWVYRTQTWYRE
jgi:uncharacterized protein (DUF2147 family)